MQNKSLTYKKIKVYLVPHSHWDREWYFTYDCSNVLLENNFNDFEKLDSKKWFLDGQWSLIDDAIKWKQNRETLIKEELFNDNLSSGPLYSQPDVFNSQAETIIRNFEIGNKVAKKLGKKQLETAYLPDTFGFGENFPQILKHCNIKNFVFWRGITEQQLDKNLFFNWKGIDGTKIKSYVLRNGYFSMGMYYPYNEKPTSFKKETIKNFIDKIEGRILNISGKHSEYILPLGGDQAPFIYNQNEFIDIANKISDKFQFILTSNYDEFLRNKKVDSEYSGNLRTPITSKIHRTITSSRYDIKKAFRDAEDRLFYLLEPLEIYYKNKDSNYEFEEYKDEHIVKPLLIAQTHDSLGGCNTDITNRHQIIRIERVRENIDSQIDLLIKKLLQSENTQEENIAIFNPAPFKNNLYKVITIYSSLNKDLNINKKNLIIKSLDSKNISLNPQKPLYKNKVIVVANSLEPLSLTKFDVSKSSDEIKVRDFKFDVINNKIKLKIGKEDVFLYLDAVEDLGDSYDFSPGKSIPLKISILNSKIIKLKDIDFINIQGKINNSKFLVHLFRDKNKLKISGSIENKFKNTRIALNIDTNKENTTIKKSLNLALTNFIDDDYIEDWKEKFNEYPANVDVQDGIIELNKKLNIFTKGTNEIYKNSHGVKIILYRTFNNVTGKDLQWRPTTSGLSWKEGAPESQLQRTLEFDFEISTGDIIKNYNSFKMEPYLYKVQHRNFIANKMNKFVINNIQGKERNFSLEMKNQNVFISSMRIIGKNLWVRVANMGLKEKECVFYLNKKENKIKLKKYEIKNVKLKG